MRRRRAIALHQRSTYTVSMSNKDLVTLLERVRSVPMTPEQKEQQRRSFTFGNVQIESPQVTRALVDRIADETPRGR